MGQFKQISICCTHCTHYYSHFNKGKKMSNFKTIAVFLVLLIFSTISQAQDPIRLVSPWGEGSIAFPFLEGFYQYDESRFMNRIDVVGSCAEVTNIIKNSDEPTIAFSEALFLSKDNPCNILNEKYFVTTVGLASLNFCTINPDDDVAIKKFQGDVRVGYFNGDMFRIPIESILRNMSGKNSRAVPYRSTPDAIAAMKAGEVDFIVTSQNNMAENCFLTTGETNDDITYKVSDFYDGKFSNAFYTLAIVGANVNKEEIKKAFINSTDPDINNIYIDGRGRSYNPELIKKDREYQLKIINDYVNHLKNAER